MAMLRLCGGPRLVLVLVAGALLLALTGCGGGAGKVGPLDKTEVAPVVNPAPGVVPLDKEAVKPGP
jgi:hypothetical protein